MKHYGMALGDVLAGAIPIWEAAELTDYLPDGCTYWQEVGGYRAWTRDQQLQAAVEFQIRINTWLQSEDGSTGKNRPAPLEPPKGKYEAEVKKEALYDRVKRHELREQARQEQLKKQAAETTTNQQ